MRTAKIAAESESAKRIFENNEEMPPKYRSHILHLGETDEKFYIRLQPKLRNFQKRKVMNPRPETATFWYLSHTNLKQYLSGNNMFSIVFSFIHNSRGEELVILCSLLHRNPFFLNLLFDLGGIDLLKDMIVEKQLSGGMDEEYLAYLFNISCNEPITTNFTQSGESSELIPRFNEMYMDFLDILMLISKRGRVSKLQYR